MKVSGGGLVGPGGGLVGQSGGVQGNQTILQSALSQPQVIKGVSWFK